MKKGTVIVVSAGAAVGLAAIFLMLLGNPANMGFCIACFLRDIAGACGLHNAAKVQYVRPEIIGLVLGALAMSLATREFRARAGSAPAVRFVLGGFVMIGALAFLGCPLRMVLRLGGGDLNALVGLIGFTIGICIGIVFLKKGFTLGRSYEAKAVEGGVLPIVMAVLLILVLAVPALFKFSEEGPGSKHAPFFIALVLALIVGALAQRTAYNEGEAWLNELLAYIDGNRRVVEEALDGTVVKYSRLEATYLMWLDMRALNLNQKDLMRFVVEKARLGLNDGTSFGEEGAGFVRLNLATPRKNVVEAMARLTAALRTL